MNTETSMLTILVPKELHIAVKVKAAKESMTISEVVREFLRQWIKEPPEESSSASVVAEPTSRPTATDTIAEEKPGSSRAIRTEASTTPTTKAARSLQRATLGF